MCNLHGSRWCKKCVWGNAGHVRVQGHRNVLLRPAGNHNDGLVNAEQTNYSNGFIVLSLASSSATASGHPYAVWHELKRRHASSQAVHGICGRWGGFCHDVDLHFEGD
jgi:hypothetical protein